MRPANRGHQTPPWVVQGPYPGGAQRARLRSEPINMILSKPRQVWGTQLKVLIGSGDRIALFTLPFLIVGLILNVAYPSPFSVGGPATGVKVRRHSAGARCVEPGER